VRDVWGHHLTAASFARSEHRPGETATQGLRKLLVADGLEREAVDARLHDWCDAFAERYVALLAEADTSHWAVAPRAAETLAALARDHDLALLTGNPERVARARMERLGLAPFFPPGSGAFGCEADERRDLVALARRRAGGARRTDTALVGDTPLDVEGAHAAGVRAIAVTTGAYGRDELTDADTVVAALAELPNVLT
jgi:phosphoglycolate phosphatase-like HAD superfamily hydrolase